MKRNLKIQVGARLFFASIALLMGNFILAGMCMIFPGFNYIGGLLAVGLTDDEKKKQDELLETILTKVKIVIDESQKDNVKKDALNGKIEEINKLIKENLDNDGIKKLKEQVDKLAKDNEALQKDLADANTALKTQSEALKKITDKGIPSTKEERKSFREAVRDAIMENKETNGFLQEVTEDGEKRLSMKQYFERNGNKQSPKMTIKAAVDMFETNIVQNNVATVRLTDLDPSRVGIPLTIYPHVLDVFNVKGIRKPYMSILVVYSYWDGTGTKDEGAASGKSSFLFKTVEFKAFFIATHFVLSDETLDDLEEALDEISIVAPDKIQDNIDSQVLGSTGDDASAIAGILTANKHTDFANPYTSDVDAPYIVDVILAAKLQAENNKYMPNAVYLNPADVYLLASKKNSFDDSQNDRRVSYDVLGNPVAVGGLRVLKSTSINQNECIVFDSKLPWIGRRRDMTMEIGYNGTDLTEGQKTVVIKIRVAFGVRDKAGIIYVDDIAAAITALAGS